MASDSFVAELARRMVGMGVDDAGGGVAAGGGVVGAGGGVTAAVEFDEALPSGLWVA